MSALPHPAAPTPASKDAGEHLLEVRDLAVHFALKRSFSDRLARRGGQVARAVDGVSLTLDRGELLALVGESGSGKTTTALAALRLLEPTAGTVLLEGRDITKLPHGDLRPLRRRAQLIHQDPYAALDPRLRTRDLIAEALRIHGLTPSKEAERAAVSDALEKVGLTPVETFAERYPHQLSGGQRQRVAIAGSLVLGPSLLVADEPVSMLDVSVRAGILQLLDGLRRDEGVGILMITHDLATAAHVSDRVAVMYHGNLVELGPARTVIDQPKHPYTQALIYAVPRVHRDEERVRTLPGEPPDASRVPSGCRFHPRCPLCEERCRREVPELLPAAGDPAVLVACHLASQNVLDHDEEGPMRVSIGDISLWFDILNPGLVPDGPVMREKPVLLALHGGPGFDHTDFKGLIEPLCDSRAGHRLRPPRQRAQRRLRPVALEPGAVGRRRARLLRGTRHRAALRAGLELRRHGRTGLCRPLSRRARRPRAALDRRAAADRALRGRLRAGRGRGGEGPLPPHHGRAGFHRLRRLPASLPAALHGQAGPRVPECPRDASGHPARRDGALPLGRGRGDGPAAGARAGRLPDAHPERPSRPDHAAREPPTRWRRRS